MLFCLAIGLAELGFAEYRVFLLKIETPSSDPNIPPNVRFIPSNLDPEQYPLYYPIKANEKISYTETWRCYGRTDSFQDYCPNPKARQPTVESLPPNFNPNP